jgi:surface antigen
MNARRMSQWRSWLGLLLVVSLTSACADRRDQGTVAGAFLGGTGAGAGCAKFLKAGPKLPYIAAGCAVIGAAAGGAIGGYFSKPDQEFKAESNLGSKPTAPPSKASEREPYCREYTSTIVVEGKSQETWGTACRRNDGSWALLN